MNTPVVDAILDEVTEEPKLCECTGEHPGPCEEYACYAVRLRHFDGCDAIETPLLCQDCLDENINEATSLVGGICTACKYEINEVSDMVGPVMPI